MAASPVRRAIGLPAVYRQRGSGVSRRSVLWDGSSCKDVCVGESVLTQHCRYACLVAFQLYTISCIEYGSCDVYWHICSVRARIFVGWQHLQSSAYVQACLPNILTHWSWTRTKMSLTNSNCVDLYCRGVLTLSVGLYTGWPKKVSHYQVSSLNRIKTVIKAKFFINYDYKMRKRMLYVWINYSMCDLICDVITCCVWSCNTGKINASDKVMF